MKYYYGTVEIKDPNERAFVGRVYHYEQSGTELVEDYRSPAVFYEEPQAVDDAVDWAESRNIEPELG